MATLFYYVVMICKMSLKTQTKKLHTLAIFLSIFSMTLMTKCCLYKKLDI